MTIKKISTILAIILSLTACSPSDFTNIVSSGGAVSTSDVHLSATHPNKIKIYFSDSRAPKKYQTIGRVSAENYNFLGMEHTQEVIMNELKKQAATLGANGIINVSNNMTQTTGEAIRVSGG